MSSAWNAGWDRKGAQYLERDQQRTKDVEGATQRSQAEAQEKFGPYAETVEKEQKSAQAGLAGLGQGTSFLGVGERERVMQDLQQRSGAAVQGAAQRGMSHSGSLLRSQQQSMMQQALASAALDSEEEQRRRQALMNVEQHISLAKEARQNIPSQYGEETGPDGRRPMGRSEVFEPEVQRMETRDRQINELLTTVRGQRLSRDDMLRGMAQNLDEVYQSSVQSRIRQAQEQGISETDIQLMVQEMEAEKGEAMQQMEGMANMLSAPNPAEAAAALQAFYTPERMEFVEQQSMNPLIPMAAGVFGAAVGGLATGNPAGAKAGYETASAVGSYYA